MILAILAIWFGYKKARDTGRNAVLWAVISGAAFIGAQLMAGLGIGVFIALGIELWGWSETVYDDYQFVITIASLVAGIVTILIIFKYLDRVASDPAAVEKPPPPPTF